MRTRRILLALVALFLVVIVVGTVGIASVLVLSRHAQTARGSLLVLGKDSHLLAFDSQGKQQVLAEDTSSDGFLYPSPAPDGTRVAYVTSGSQGTALMVLTLSSGERKQLFTISAPTQLFYMTWSPDSRYISFLSPDENGSLGVSVVPADGSAEPRVVSRDQRAAFFAWTPDSQKLLVHSNGSVFEQGSLATFALGSNQPQQIQQDPGFFQAPAWSADGKQVFYVLQPKIQTDQPSFDDVVSVLTRAAPDGSAPTELVREVASVIYFSRAPGSDQLAYTTFSLKTKTFGPLTLVDGATGKHDAISRSGDKVVAFFWSPDGKQLAYLTREDERDPRTDHTWHVVGSGGGEVRDFARFTPTQSFSGLVTFFDAYALSFNLWSPDGKQLTYAAADGVYTLDATSGTTKRMSEGVLGVWMRSGMK